MTELLTSAQMRAAEQAAIASGAVTGLELMERAGRGVVEAVLGEWPDLAKAPHRAVVLCGPGNNGGDGFVVARLLKERGWQVDPYLFADASRLPPDARTNHDRWMQMGRVHAFPEHRPDPRSAAIVVDAGFGTGLTRALDAELIAAFLGSVPDRRVGRADRQPHVVAVDIATGLSADTGALLPAAVMADMTVTFHRAKLGHYLARGPDFTGRLRVAPIGLDTDQGPAPKLDGVVTLASADRGRLAKGVGSHKYSHGHALVVSGGAGQGGAGRLAARGALRIGAGLVTLGCPPAALQENAAQLTAVMLKPVEDAGALKAALGDGRLNALCLGPGLGIERARELVPVALGAERATVLDADALTAFADEPETLFAMLRSHCVLTPHGGEFARLFPDIHAGLEASTERGGRYSKVDAVRDAAARSGCVVLCKGADTVVAAPDGRCSISSARYDRAAPWLATAGSGDVLAGFVTGLLARGFPPVEAAETAAWLHVECARSFGPGLIAEDLPEEVPKVLRALGP